MDAQQLLCSILKAGAFWWEKNPSLGKGGWHIHPFVFCYLSLFFSACSLNGERHQCQGSSCHPVICGNLWWTKVSVLTFQSQKEIFSIIFYSKRNIFWVIHVTGSCFFHFCSLIEELARLITLSHFIQNLWILGKDEKLSRVGKRCVRRVHFHWWWQSFFRATPCLAEYLPGLFGSSQPLSLIC